MTSSISNVFRRVVSFAALAVGSAVFGLACSSGSGTSLAGDAGSSGGLGIILPDGGTATGGSSAAGGATSSAGGATATCTRDGQTCTNPDQCCSEACVDGVCVEFGACTGAGTACTTASGCCSGRCEPVTGQAGVLECTNFCLRDGQACTKAVDCCSLGCFGGKCGGGLCVVEGQPCGSNAECCSNICDPAKGECAIDLANRNCRPTGEDCNSGSGSGCCEVCNDQTQRCDFGPGTCRPQGAGCATNADCCKGKCLPNAANQLTCQIPCLADGTSCTINAECCGFDCNGTPARCGAPAGAPAPTCTPTGKTCAANADCCSGFCLNGLCDLRCRLTADTCATNADCCSGLCTGGTCAPVVVVK